MAAVDQEEAATVTAFAHTIGQALVDPAAVGDDATATDADPNRYDIQRELGEGGMGRVLEAVDRQFGRRVALKEMLSTSSASLRARFHVEAVVTANLEHPGVPPVYDRGIDANGRPYYAMRLIRGRTLGEAIADAANAKARLQLVPVVVRVAQTLAYAHEHGVVHRDVKPANIVIGRHGEAVLLDWGIAKVRGVAGADAMLEPHHGERSGAAVTRHGAVVGTPSYMAPEQAKGDVGAIDERTDVFALGGLLYHVLSGRPPFEGPTMESMIERALSADFPSLEQLEPKAPARLAAICARAMAVEPSDRFDSAAELADALEAALTDALTDRGSRLVDAIATVVSVGMVAAAIATAAMVWRVVPGFELLGWGVFPTIALGITALLMGLLEIGTRGRQQLSSLVLALGGMTVVGGAVSMLTGLFHTLEAAIGPKPVVSGWIVAQGSYESLGNMVVGLGMGGAALLLWGVARRRTLRQDA